MTWITATLVLSTSSAWSCMSLKYISTLAIAQYPCPMNVRIAPDEVETMLDRGTSQRTRKGRLGRLARPRIGQTVQHSSHFVNFVHFNLESLQTG